ncbi:hypothetical protein N836_15840 [Leptolyngbya sp. Heron Island J]|nr:hypothetical protein N836_15840 [Leptolyngbya sp. Heron Island J]
MVNLLISTFGLMISASLASALYKPKPDRVSTMATHLNQRDGKMAIALTNPRFGFWHTH